MFDLSGTMAAMCDVVGDRLKARRSYHTGQPPQPEPAAPQKATRRSEMRVQEKPEPAPAPVPVPVAVVEPEEHIEVERVAVPQVDLSTPPAGFPEAPPESPAKVGKPDWWANFRRAYKQEAKSDDPMDAPKFDGEMGRTRIGDDVVVAITETRDNFVFVSAKRLVKRSGEWKMESYKTAIVKGTLKSAVDDDWLTAHQWLHGLLNTTCQILSPEGDSLPST
jgi:hypothetical protein